MSSMCHTMHSGYQWKLFHSEENVKWVFAVYVRLLHIVSLIAMVAMAFHA